MAILATITTMDDTGSITRADLSRRFALALLVVSLSLVLLSLSWPRLQAALIYLPVEAAIQAHWNGSPIPADQLSTLEMRAREAIDVHSYPHYWEGLSLLSYLEALQQGSRLNQQRLAFESSVVGANESLKLAPIQPRLWMRRADVMDWLSFRPEPALDALKMSVLTGRVEPMLQSSRLRLGYDRLGSLDEEGRQLLADQTQLAWQMRQAEVLRALRRGELRINRVKYLLASTHPDLLREIEQALSPGP